MDDESASSNRRRASGLQRRSLKLLPLKLAGAYLIIAVLWTFVSHFWLDTFVPSSVELKHLKSIEDLLFAGITAGMLYWLARRSLRALQQTETTLRESEERLRLILQKMPVMLNAFDRQGNIIIWNHECERVTGYSAAEMIGNPQAMALLYPDAIYRQQMTAAWVERGNDYRNWEWNLVSKDGTENTVAWSNISDHFPIPGWMSWGIGVDVTDRKQAEAQIRQLNQTLEQQNLELEALVEQRTAELMTFINTLPDYIFVVERDTMRMPFCNDAIAHLIGWENRHQVAGKTIFECFAPDLATTFAKQNQQVFASSETLHFQENYTTPLGSFHFDTYKIPLKQPNGEVYALIGSSRDVTELVVARQTLSDRTAELEMVNRELESFSYSVSHDLRAPLRHIGGFVTALTDRLQQDGHLSDPTTVRYLEIIQNSSHKMGALIDGLLMLSRVGRRQMVDTRVDLNQLVAAVLAERPELTTSSTTETVSDRQPVQFSVGALPTVKGDATLLQQVFVNLLDNAIKFSRHRHPAQVEIGALADGTVFVRDDGAGFQMEYADQLFGAFQRLHSQSEFEGSGIGLAIVQRIIHRHGGSIWAESQPNQGATFYFTLGDRLGQLGQAN